MREHSRFEKARVIGARALQISMGAPVDIKVPKDIIDPVIIAQMEYDTDAIKANVATKTPNFLIFCSILFTLFRPITPLTIGTR